MVGKIDVLFINIQTNAVPSPQGCGKIGRASACERIKDGITRKAEHANEALSELEWIGRWVLGYVYNRCKKSRFHCYVKSIG